MSHMTTQHASISTVQMRESHLTIVSTDEQGNKHTNRFPYEALKPRLEPLIADKLGELIGEAGKFAEDYTAALGRIRGRLAKEDGRPEVALGRFIATGERTTVVADSVVP